VVYKRVDPKTHVNVLDGLIGQLRKRDGIAYLKRLTIVLDEDSEKGFGLVRDFCFIYISLNFWRLTRTL
jgi:ribonuclease P/MRP protein subunit RPP1